MNKHLLILTNSLLISVFCFCCQICVAQSSYEKAMQMRNQMLNQSGKLTFTIKGKNYTIKTNLVKTKYNEYVIAGGLIGEDNTLTLIVPKIEAGNYTMSGNKQQAILVFNQTPFIINNGSITIKPNGSKIEGSFKGKYYPPNGKGKFSTEAEGEISGTFSDLSLL